MFFLVLRWSMSRQRSSVKARNSSISPFKLSNRFRMSEVTFHMAIMQMINTTPEMEDAQKVIVWTFIFGSRAGL